MRFYIGIDRANWLTSDVPTCISHRTLRHRRSLPRAANPWILDSGAFTEISTLGHFETTAAEYLTAVRRYRDEIGRLDWAAPQDHMCEPWVLARSELASTVTEAQSWTVDNYVTLRALAADLPIIPVLQGQTVADYLAHVERYDRAGIDLETEPVVGVGSVCRRQATADIGAIIGALAGLRLHGFGVKASGIARYGWMLASADSMAWSYGGRRTRPCPHSPTRQSCAHCWPFALEWRRRVLDQQRHRRPVQLELTP